MFGVGLGGGPPKLNPVSKQEPEKKGKNGKKIGLVFWGHFGSFRFSQDTGVPPGLGPPTPLVSS